VPYQTTNATHSPAWWGPQETFHSEWGWFLARAVSHFCAPGFSFLMGLSMVLLAAARTDPARMRAAYGPGAGSGNGRAAHGSEEEGRAWGSARVLRFFALRGALLVALGFVVRGAGLLRLLVPSRPGNRSAAHYLVSFFQVMTCLGLQMTVAAPVVVRAVAGCARVAAEQRSELEGGVGAERAAAGERAAARYVARWQAWLLVVGLGCFVATNAVVESFWGPGGDPAAARAPPNADGLGALLRCWLFLPGSFDGLHSLDFYPLFGWLGFCLWGVASGLDFRRDAARAQRRLGRLAPALLGAFLLVRLCGGRYGNLRGWPIGEYGGGGEASSAASGSARALAFFNVNKYPPSLAYVFGTLGLVFAALSALHRASAADRAAQAQAQAQGRTGRLGWRARARARVLRVLLAYGSSPLAFYVTHFYLLEALASLAYVAMGAPPDREGVPLWGALLMWSCVVLPLELLLCARYARFKGSKGPNSVWRFF
jgi:uncharacterized membrane protein